MSKVASLDNERVRAVRVELAKLVADRYRKPGHEPELREKLIDRHVKTLPQSDRAAFLAAELNRLAKYAGELDWSLLKDDKVQRELFAAIELVLARWSEKLGATAEDLFQAGCLIVAEQSKQAKKELAKGFLRRWIYQKLVHLVEHEHRDVSLEALRAGE